MYISEYLGPFPPVNNIPPMLHTKSSFTCHPYDKDKRAKTRNLFQKRNIGW